MKTYKESKKHTFDTENVTLDVVCGMDVDTEKAKCSSMYHGVTYYFCSHHCKQHFDNNPERYVWDK